MTRRILRGYARHLYHSTFRAVNHWRNRATDFRPKLLVLVYHRVLADTGSNPFEMVVSSDTFVRQIDYLASHYPIISLDDAIAQCDRAQARAKEQVVLTFDDGFRDNYETVFPVLSRKGIPAAFFVSTDLVGSQTPHRFWTDAVKKDTYRDDLCMTWEQVKALSAGGMVIGSHGMSHRSLARIPFEEASVEITGSKAVIEKETLKPCKYFAFPFGSRKDYGSALIDCAKNAGYEGIFLNVHGYNRFTPHMAALKRIIMEEHVNPGHLLG